jgi:hypothetical protein
MIKHLKVLRFITFLSIFIFDNSVNGQNLQIVLDPIVQNSNGSIFNLTLINNSDYSGTVKLSAVLKTIKGNILLKQEAFIDIASKEFKRVDKYAVNTVFIENRFSELYQPGFSLPPYDYLLCVNAGFVNDLSVRSEDCIEYLASDFISLIPVSPPNDEIIYHAQPTFSWINTVTGNNYSYNFKLVKVNSSQNANVAVRRNQPIVEIVDLSQTNLEYPSDANPLKNGEKYAWQLGIQVGGIEVAKSDAFSFVYKDEDVLIDIPRDLSYVDIKEVPNGAELYAVGVFKFRYKSKFDGKLEVYLYDIDKDKWISLEENTLEILKGDNKFDFDLKNQVYLKHKKVYKLKFIDNNQKIYFMNVKYLNPDYLK